MHPSLNSNAALLSAGCRKHDGPPKMAGPGWEDRATQLIGLERPQRTSRIPPREKLRGPEGSDTKLVEYWDARASVVPSPFSSYYIQAGEAVTP